MKAFVVVISGLLLAAPAIAQTPGDAAMGGGGSAPAEERSEPARDEARSGTETKSERRICRRVETTASRVGAQRLCMTAAEWREFNRHN